MLCWLEIWECSAAFPRILLLHCLPFSQHRQNMENIPISSIFLFAPHNGAPRQEKKQERVFPSTWNDRMQLTAHCKLLCVPFPIPGAIQLQGQNNSNKNFRKLLESLNPVADLFQPFRVWRRCWWMCLSGFCGELLLKRLEESQGILRSIWETTWPREFLGSYGFYTE